MGRWERRQLRPYTNAALPDEVQRWASSSWLFKEQSTVIQFRAGPRTLRFGELEIGVRELHILSFGLLQHTLSTVNLPPNLEECWDELSAALYGYQTRVFTQEQISQLTLYGAQSKRQFSLSLRRRHEELLARWEMLFELIPHLKQEGNRPAELVSRHNARWTAEQVVFAYNGLQALVKGGGLYASTLSECIGPLDSCIADQLLIHEHSNSPVPQNPFPLDVLECQLTLMGRIERNPGSALFPNVTSP
ncbi:hypothetical protein FA13DRAFT_9074 [Coprinellus micaceus]|uniref:Uncharacterized protein n=1 Tax=Coprinellus micaceus TaxID=71717 RepID=A0A4Y7TZX3_COPMI|nr:hypothetical protein FA13DRAFT_9074 [Coprinellus micaceus]